MAAERPQAKPFADSRLSVQFDRIDLAERGCAALAAEARRAGADAIQIERCDFYLDGEARKRALEPLAGEIRFFEDEGFPVALWISSLGYGRMADPDFLRRFPDYRPLVAPDGSTAAVCSTYALRRGADGGKFAVCDKGWTEIDCREATHDAVPFRDIWRFFTGEDLPV